MEIIQITEKNHPFVPTLCKWLLSWWGKNEGFSYEKMQYYLENSLNGNQSLPQTFVLTLNNKPIGMYQFSITDLDVRPDIYPWVINIYIDPAYQCNGYLHLLMASVKEKAIALGLKELYLYTYHQNLYEKYGFLFIENFPTFIQRGDTQRLYHYDFKEKK